MREYAFETDYDNTQRDEELDRRDRLAEASGGDDAAADCGLFFTPPPDLPTLAIRQTPPHAEKHCLRCEGRGYIEFFSEATSEWGECPCPECGGNGQ